MPQKIYKLRGMEEGVDSKAAHLLVTCVHYVTMGCYELILDV